MSSSQLQKHVIFFYILRYHILVKCIRKTLVKIPKYQQPRALASNPQHHASCDDTHANNTGNKTAERQLQLLWTVAEYFKGAMDAFDCTKVPVIKEKLFVPLSKVPTRGFRSLFKASASWLLKKCLCHYDLDKILESTCCDSSPAQRISLD